MISLFPGISDAQSWYNNSWLYRKLITIDFTKVGTGPHTNFPVLINITDTNLQSLAQADGDDILFTSNNGTTKLDHQIENYTSGTGALVAWVEVPSLSSTANTTIYMYYGNAAAASQQNITGTWNANYRGVWHLNGVFTDATINASNGTNTGTLAATGKISNGRQFVRSDGADFITVTGKMGSPPSFTISAWANITSADVNAADIVSIADDAVLRYDVGNGKVTGSMFVGGATWRETRSAANFSTYLSGWHYLVYTYDNTGDLQRIYVDGLQNGAGTSFTEAPDFTGGTNTFIGKHGNGNVNMDCDGMIDEVRISNSASSAGWVLTEYNNQNSPATFHSVGSQESLKIFTGTGNFSAAARWTSGTVPIAGDYLIIDGACTVDNNAGTDNVAYGPLVIGTGTARSMVWAASGTNRLNVTNVTAGSVVGNTLNMTNGGTLIVRGTLTSTNLTFTPGAGTMEFRSTATLPSAYTSYNNLTVNGSGATITLSAATTTITGNLSITSGTLNANGLNITLSGNWSNSGTFTAGTGTVTFSGANTQTVAQSGSGNFYNLTVNKSGNQVTLSNSITVTNSLTLTARFVQLGTNNLTIGSAGSITGGSASSYVVTNSTGGLVQNNIGSTGRTGSILFPVGATTSSYTPASINNTSTSDAFTARVFDGVNMNGTTGAAVTSYVVLKTWMISEAVAGGSSVALTVQWNAADEGTGFVRSSCMVSQYVGPTWSASTLAAAAGSNPYTSSRSAISSFSAFAVEGTETPLPVTWLYFEVKQENKKNVLEWATASEHNNLGFAIEKAYDGIHFDSIGFVEGHGNSGMKHSYHFADANDAIRRSYYRLKQIDWDEQSEYSDVIYAPAVESDFAIYPNPVSLWVKIYGNEDLTQGSSLILEVFSDKGEGVIFYAGILSDANKVLNDKLGNLKPGAYVVKIKSKNQDYTAKFIKL